MIESRGWRCGVIGGFARRRFEAEYDIYREDAVFAAVFAYLQSGERIRGRKNIQESPFVQPNKKHFAVG